MSLIKYINNHHTTLSVGPCVMSHLGVVISICCLAGPMGGSLIDCEYHSLKTIYVISIVYKSLFASTLPDFEQTLKIDYFQNLAHCWARIDNFNIGPVFIGRFT